MLYTHCNRCGKPLTNPESMRIGLGPVCLEKSETESTGDSPKTLVRITKPYEFDVVLKRNEDGSASTNVPHSVISHSPDGFEWGYGGSGPSDLALNILNAFIPPNTDGAKPVNCHKHQASKTAYVLHQNFKRKFLCAMDEQGGRISKKAIKDFIAQYN